MAPTFSARDKPATKPAPGQTGHAVPGSFNLTEALISLEAPRLSPDESGPAHAA